MPGPMNAPLGDQGIDELPQTQVPQEDLSREKSMAAFARSDEYKNLKKVMEQRIEHYMRYMPGSVDVEVSKLNNEERGYMWLASSVIIDEFRSIFSAYEQAEEAVRESANR